MASEYKVQATIEEIRKEQDPQALKKLVEELNADYLVDEDELEEALKILAAKIDPAEFTEFITALMDFEQSWEDAQ